MRHRALLVGLLFACRGQVSPQAPAPAPTVEPPPPQGPAAPRFEDDDQLQRSLQRLAALKQQQTPAAPGQPNTDGAPPAGLVRGDAPAAGGPGAGAGRGAIQPSQTPGVEGQSPAGVAGDALASPDGEATPRAPVAAGQPAVAFADAAADRALDAVPGLLKAGRGAEAVALLDAALRTHDEGRSQRAEATLLTLTAAVSGALQRGRLRELDEMLQALAALPATRPKVRSSLAKVFGASAMAREAATDFDGARRDAQASLQFDEQEPLAWLVLGRLRYHENDLRGAIDQWQTGLRRNPNEPQLTLELARHQREQPTEGALAQKRSEHFVLSFDGESDDEAAQVALEILEQARKDVGALYGLLPDDKVPVILYPHQAFAERAGHPVWSAGLYDGKVRVPSQGAASQTVMFRALLFHEYGHALLHRLTHGAVVPAWFNEGLAKVAGRLPSSEPALTCPMGHRAPLGALEKSFGSLNASAAHGAYLTAQHAVERLGERFSADKVRAVMAEVPKAGSFSKAFERSFGVSYQQYLQQFDAEPLENR